MAAITIHDPVVLLVVAVVFIAAILVIAGRR